ncbi:MAG TPA: hypothetical protein VF713_12720, partial [Thermoanaerobaculia bacterium]
TRALDWTSSSLTAAYFAARLPANAQADSIAVWVFNVAAYEPEMQDATQQQPLLVLRSAPGADNDNLRAQRGLFMLHPQELADHNERFTPLPYDELLRDHQEAASRPLMFRVTAPASSAQSILLNLAAAGISAGALFPGLWGVAREIEEQEAFPPGAGGFGINRTQTAEAIIKKMMDSWAAEADKKKSNQ